MRKYLIPLAFTTVLLVLTACNGNVVVIDNCYAEPNGVIINIGHLPKLPLRP